ncbi:MAG: ATP-binding protein [Bacteroidales bacterium]|nr:ATP-binding protein [Bacteroidales bacterium]
MKKEKNRLTKPWLLICILAFLTIVLLVWAGLYFRQLRSELKAEQYKLLSAVAAFKVNEITKWLSERKAEGVFFSNSLGFKSLMKKLDKDPTDHQTRETMKSWLIPAKKNHEYNSIYIYNHSGKLLFIIKDGPNGNLVDQGPLKGYSNKEIVFSDLKKTEDTNSAIIEMVVPIVDKSALIGWVKFTIDPEYYLFPLIKMYPIHRYTAQNLLVQRLGDSLTCFPHEKGDDEVALRNNSISHNGAITKSIPLSGTFARVETKDFRGNDILADIRMVPGTRWSLISKIDLLEISKPLYYRAVNISLFILVLLAMFIIAMILIWKNHQLLHVRSQLDFQTSANQAREKISFMNALLQEVNDAIITFDKDMMILSWNKGAERIYGWKAEEVIGKFSGGALRVHFRETSRDEVFRELEQTGAWKGEVVHKRKDGSTVYVLSSTSRLRDSNGNVLGIMAINKDITEVVLSEKVQNAVYQISELAQSSRDLDEMFTSIHVVIGELMDVRNIYIALIEPDGKTLTFPYFVDEKDTTPGLRPMGRGLTEYVLKTGKPLLAKPEDTQYFVDREIIDLVGTPAIDWLGIPLRNEKETFGALVVQSYDPQIRYGDHEKDILTFVSAQVALSIQRKKIQQELVDARQKAEVSNKLTSALLANMNHELRTPMNGILGFAEILFNDLTDAEMKVKAENILNSGRRLMNTLDAIMDLSYLESDHVSRKFRPVRVAQVVQSVSRNYERDISFKKLTFIQEINPDLAISGDEHLFHHLIRILVDNAVKYTEKGSISIKASAIQKENAEMVSVSVVDTGIGISPENHRMIFDPFRQVSEGYGRHFEGSGLGLSIAKKIVDLMQGTITLHSTLGVGSEFTLLLPRVPYAVPVSETGLSKSKRSLSRFKKLPDVLIVEDNIVNIQLLMIYLRKYCNIFTTIDAPSAIDLAKKHRFDAVFMDINLGPGMDGIQAMLEIRGLPGNQYLPVIAVTGYASIGDRERLIQIGFTEYIPKPFDKETIATVMNNLFPKT